MSVMRNWRDQSPRIGHDNAIIWSLLVHEGDRDRKADAAHLKSRSRVVRHRVQAGMNGDYHNHEDAEQLYYILRGQGTLLLGAEKHAVREGDIVYIPPKLYHRLFNDSSNWMEHLILSFQLSEERQEEAKEPPEPLVRNWREQSPYAEGHGDQILWPLLRHRDTPPIKHLTEPKDYCLTRDLYDISRNALQPRGRSKEHSHQGIEQIYYILDGRAQILLGEEKREVREGDTILLEEGDPHQLINDGEEWVEYLILSCKLPETS